MESSNTPDITADVTIEAASPVESSAPEITRDSQSDVMPSAPPEKELSLKDKILAQKEKNKQPAEAASPDDEIVPEKTETPPAVVPAEGQAPAPATPQFQPNYKFKAFGKEKEIPEMFRSVIKDENSERQVREVFTRAEAFDDMKARFEHSSREGQHVLNEFTALDRDVRRVTGFLAKGDIDNFLKSVRLSDNDLIKYLQTKAQYMQDPQLSQQYQNQVQQREELYNRNEQYQNLQTSYSNQAVQARTMQLDNILSRQDVSSVASQWDTQTGEIGAFRNLVIGEAASYYALHKQDLSAEQAVNVALQKFGRLIPKASPQAVAPGQAAPAAMNPQAPAPQAPQAPVVVAPKPAIPTLQGKGTSPVKQVPKSLDDLKRMGKEIARAEAQG